MLEDAAAIRKVVIACGYVDLRKGIDGLSMIIGDRYRQNLFEKGTLFLFCCRRSDRIKGLLWMGDGFLLLYKRLESGSLSWPHTSEEAVPVHSVSMEQLDAFYGKGCWRRMPDEVYKRLRHEPESWTVEVHTVEVYVGTDRDHQDEFVRGNRPKDLLRNSIVTPSLLASILNVKYVNSSALHRVEQEFQRNGVNISRQTMSNWIIKCADRYFAPFVERMKQELFSLPSPRWMKPRPR